ncbi:MAG TPA: 16S rRNA (cytosine(1402)-N(4))-methyltransferase, partial [Candidatus Marinimicrobia bacterium]|nr:16S rRNA (cytosine(1402)-N(4))-methyltransferase [Candidatus Neomarinimicrobiota bacterium]
MTSEWGATKKHIPVLQEDVLSYLAVKPDGIYLDGTLGFGGHASAVQKQLSPKGQLVGFDGDE